MVFKPLHRTHLSSCLALLIVGFGIALTCLASDLGRAELTQREPVAGLQGDIQGSAPTISSQKTGANGVASANYAALNGMSNNIVQLQQQGNHLQLSIAQNGLRNELNASQSGANQFANLLQTGQDNSIFLHQSGFANQALVEQQGHENMARIEQYGQNGRATITQIGSGMRATTIQY